MLIHPGVISAHGLQWLAVYTPSRTPTSARADLQRNSLLAREAIA